MAVRSLYICYFGVREPLVQTQVLPYLRELVAGGNSISLLTFEPKMKKLWDDAAIAEWRGRLRSEGIEWHLLPYHKRPSIPAKIYDALRGAIRSAAIVRREKIDVIHARSHAAAAMGALVRVVTGARLLFDFRGFLAEEYVDSGNWRAGGIFFRTTKAAEKWLFRSADGIVVLTETARNTLDNGSVPVEVIPCCVDPQRFNAVQPRDVVELRAQLGITDRLVYVYAGSVGGSYLVRETVEFLAAARAIDPRTFALILTQGPHDEIVDTLKASGFSANDYLVLSVAAEEVPRYLRVADIAMLFVRRSPARAAQSPTKFAEYLAAGLPVVCSAGISDLDAQVEENRVGVLLHAFDRATLASAAGAASELARDPELANRCRALIAKAYDLRAVGGPRYRRLYEALARR